MLTPMSTFTWLDTAEADRRQALDIIDAFRERDTRDELGLGTIRDAISDLLFPGTTTIQTRARYLLFVPWIYRELERKKVDSANIARRARAAEIALIEALAARETEGVIGIQARSRLQRLPSAIYWQGLGSWGIRRFPGSQDQYHRALDAFYRRTSDRRRDDDGELADAPGENWDPGLPAPPSDFPETATLQLGAEERDYLRDKIALRHPGTLLAFLAAGEAWEPVPFAWHHPRITEAPQHNLVQLHHARSFAELIHGAQLLYNLMLAEAREWSELRDVYRDRLETWAHVVNATWEARRGWIESELPDFWRLIERARVPRPTCTFVEDWLRRLVVLGPFEIVDDPDARELIRRREVRLKRRLARLENKAALGMWGGAAGASQLDFRWRITQILLLDILEAADADA
jgi:hypothetical protein